ncbi:MAG: glycosyltransferase involved in cell wall biosynthesis [Bacteroidia bacterium]
MKGNIPIVLVGPYPPNIGGVSTHIFRLLPLLKKEGRIVSVISTNKIERGHSKDVKYIHPIILVFNLFFGQSSLVHFHVDSTNHLILAAILRLRHNIILTIHNNRYLTTMSKPTASNWLRFRLLSSFADIICVNTDTKKFLENKLSNVHPEVIPAFLPPTEIDESSLESIKEWGAKFDKVLSGYAYRLSFYKGVDLYGIDLMIGLMDQLIRQKINVGLVLLINLEESDYLTTIKSRISNLNLEQYIKLEDIKGGIDAVALWRYSDIYLRPTNTDGNSISVLEALTVGTSVVASDCVERPKGVTLFEDRSLDDFVGKVLGSLSDASVPKTYKLSNNKIIQIY